MTRKKCHKNCVFCGKNVDYRNRCSTSVRTKEKLLCINRFHLRCFRNAVRDIRKRDILKLARFNGKVEK